MKQKQSNDIKLEYNSKSRIKSHIYSDVNELIIEKSTLFNYVLIVGLKDRKSHSTDELNNEFYSNKLNPIVLWQFPENVVKT